MTHDDRILEKDRNLREVRHERAIAPTLLRPLIVSACQQNPRRFLSEKPLSVEAGEILDEIRVALVSDLNAASAGVERLAALLRGTAAERFRPIPARGGLAEWQRRTVLAYIDSRLDESILIKSLADVTSLSVSYFCHAFRQSFGMTPHAYIIRKRVMRAQELMLTTGEPLSRIALSCGFTDQGHLSKLFRREIGQTPSIWRRINAIEPHAEEVCTGREVQASG